MSEPNKSAPRIVVVGSLVYDFVATADRLPRKGETVLGTSFGMFAGGKGANQAAWFQENVDSGSTIWAGNAFVSDHKAIKLTLVCDGLAPGRAPFLEVHNPTDDPIRTVITSPPPTPRFGNFSTTVDVPAGASVAIPCSHARQERG